jgi:hypothetical protein
VDIKSWDSEYPFIVEGSDNTNLTFSDDLIYGGTNSGTPSSGFTTDDPDFISPPYYDPSQGGQYADTISPLDLSDDLDISSGSPAIGAGIDPVSLTGTNTDLASDLANYIYTDINGNSRPVNGPFDLGAYEASAE